VQNPKGKGFQRHLGSYETAEDAARCYDRAVLKLRGEAAELNFPRQEYEQVGAAVGAGGGVRRFVQVPEAFQQCVGVWVGITFPRQEYEQVGAGPRLCLDLPCLALAPSLSPHQPTPSGFTAPIVASTCATPAIP